MIRSLKGTDVVYPNFSKLKQAIRKTVYSMRSKKAKGGRCAEGTTNELRDYKQKARYFIEEGNLTIITNQGGASND